MTDPIQPGKQEPDRQIAPDKIASLTLAVVAGCCLIGAWILPWWVMESRAPQYGPRVLLVEVGPISVGGDIIELDTLGHYVGIRSLNTLAQFERALAPLGMVVAIVGVFVMPWLKRRWMRVAAVMPVVILPVFFLADIQFWMHKSTHDLDPEAAMQIPDIQPRLFGEYTVGQFKVKSKAAAGLYLVAVGAALGLGLAFATPLPLPRKPVKKTAATSAAAAILILCVPWSANAAEHTAGPSDRLADVLARAGPGDTVSISAGIYREHIVVDRPISLRGQSGAILDGGNTGTVVKIISPGVEIRGLTIRASGDSYNAEDSGIRIEAPDVRIVDTRIEDTLFGIFAIKADRCIIENSTIIGKDISIFRRGDGIRLWYSQGCRLLGNRVERSRDVVIWYSSKVVSENNIVRHSRYGLHYMYSDDNVFYRNRFEDNEVAAAIMYSRRIELADNDFSFSTGPSAYGLLIKDADDVFITKNRFIENSTGLFIDGAPQSRGGRVDVHDNLFARNQAGVALQPLSRGVRFWNNSFVGNQASVQIQGTGSAQSNIWSVDGRGNFWSEAVVYDANRDGVSDLPYQLDSTYEVLADRYPALTFFSNTQAADTIDMAARWFPLYAPRPRVVDPNPLVRPPVETAKSYHQNQGHSIFMAGAVMVTLGISMLKGSRKLLT